MIITNGIKIKFDVSKTSFLLWRAPATHTSPFCNEHIFIMSLRIILVFTAFIEDMLKLNLVCFFLFCYENELNDRTIIRTFQTPLV